MYPKKTNNFAKMYSQVWSSKDSYSSERKKKRANVKIVDYLH